MTCLSLSRHTGPIQESRVGGRRGSFGASGRGWPGRSSSLCANLQCGCGGRAFATPRHAPGRVAGLWASWCARVERGGGTQACTPAWAEELGSEPRHAEPAEHRKQQQPRHSIHAHRPRHGAGGQRHGGGSGAARLHTRAIHCMAGDAVTSVPWGRTLFWPLAGHEWRRGAYSAPHATSRCRLRVMSGIQAPTPFRAHLKSS